MHCHRNSVTVILDKKLAAQWRPKLTELDIDKYLLVEVADHTPRTAASLVPNGRGQRESRNSGRCDATQSQRSAAMFRLD